MTDADAAAAAPLFDPAFYQAQRSDLIGSPADLLRHYLNHGWQEGVAPHPCFDVGFYRAQVQRTGHAMTEADVLHYLRSGEAQGLRPNVYFSPLFYRGVYGAVPGGGSPFVHYLTQGEAAGRLASPEFRPRRYASSFLGYAAQASALQHAMRHPRPGAILPPPVDPVPPPAANRRSAKGIVLLLLGPADPEARPAQLLDADGPDGPEVVIVADARAAIAWAGRQKKRRPVVLVAGAALLPREDMMRLVDAAPAHPLVMDRAGDVFHAGYRPETGVALPRGPGWNPAHPSLGAWRTGLVTPGPVLALPSAAPLASVWADSLPDLFLALSSGARYVPAASALQVDAVVGGPGAAPVDTDLPAAIPQPRMLFIDSIIPRMAFDAGSFYAMQLMAMYQAFGYDVTLIPDAEMAGDPALLSPLQARGIEVIQAPFAADAAAYIAQTEAAFDVIVLSRFNCGGRHLEALMDRWPRARRVFHPGDLHHIREMREAILREDPELFRAAIATKHRELQIVRQVDKTVVVSAFEEQALQAAGLGDIVVRIDPAYVNRPPAPYDPATRHGIAFIGGYGHQPNVDAVLFLCERIWPIVSAARPDIRLSIVGSNPPQSFAAYASAQIEVLGRVDDLDGLLDGLRFTVAPLRFGAGVKMKLISSLAAGVPVLCTALAAEGIGLPDEAGLVLAEGPAVFAQAVIDLYDDADRLRALSGAGFAAVVNRFSEDAVRADYRSRVMGA